MYNPTVSPTQAVRHLPIPGSLGPKSVSFDRLDLTSGRATPPRGAPPRPTVKPAQAALVPGPSTASLVAAVANAACHAAAMGCLSVPTSLPMPPVIPYYPADYYPVSPTLDAWMW